MKTYSVNYKFYYDGVLCNDANDVLLLNVPCDEEIAGCNFNDLWNLCSEYAIFIPLSRWEFKKGKPFMQFYDALVSRITPKNCKPWKLVITSEETTISMEQLMRFDAEKVISYLKERGMTACPISIK